MADELIDIVNKQDEIIGQAMKSEAHGNIDMIHREVSICVFDNKGNVLLQQRSMTKKNDPGGWTITAAGHVGAGEDPKLSVVREVQEELGITVEPLFFKKIFERDERHQESKFYYIYYAFTDETKLTLQEEEVMNAKFTTIDDALDNVLTSETSKEILKMLQDKIIKP